ncbi:MAG: 30S ribosomal protein S3 [Candidatus Gracilibacteria bacterium]|nr:30S ribosomal protein S3 [bacterium]MDZ4217062.1 30S ribosomal protein S3 [Candidatus Gracilibacteria bacterium]
MGQKVSPKTIRLNITHKWPAKWYARKRKYSQLVVRDILLRKQIAEILPDSGISKIEIERSNKNLIVTIHTAKPGIIIGKKGDSIDELKKKLSQKFGEHIEINIQEVKKPDLDAQIIGDSIAYQIERRGSYRRAAKQAVQKSMDAGAIGVKIFIGGRLNGVDIARSEFFKEGNIPLHTFRADIDYAKSTAITTYGAIGIKVWIYKGNIYKHDKID